LPPCHKLHVSTTSETARQNNLVTMLKNANTSNYLKEEHRHGKSILVRNNMSQLKIPVRARVTSVQRKLERTISQR